MKKCHNSQSTLISATLGLILVFSGLAPQPQTIAPSGNTPIVDTEEVQVQEGSVTSVKDSIKPNHDTTADTNYDTTYRTQNLKSAEKSIKNQNSPSSLESPFIQEYVLGEYVFAKNGTGKYPIRTYKTSITPNDPYAGQWWEGSLNLPAAWNIGTGSIDTTLAIIDTGFALSHEEFAGRWHVNIGESGSTSTELPSKLNCTDQSIAIDKNCNLIDDDFDGIVDNESGTTTSENPSQLNCTDQGTAINKNCNIIDDDGNGLVDDYTGWDFVNYDNSVHAGDIDPSGSGTRHGSYVAGVAAANANNGVGIAGVNWQTKILPIQALSDSGSGTTVSVARAIRYAVAQGADVISLSLGSTYPDAFLRQTITEAISAGVIIVAASGNNGCDCISYPANYVEVVAVGALSSSNTPAGFSSYGDNLDILAPGVGLYTASWTQSNQTSAYASNISGTSLATPLVSASLTLLKSHRPDATSTELLALLSETTDRLNLPTDFARSNTLGFGTVNLLDASTRATTPKIHNNVIGLIGTKHGDTLYANYDLENTSSLSIYECSAGTLGTTPVYRLQKSNIVFYSTSSSEIGQAQANGFTTRLLGYYCAVMPHDSVNNFRNLNVFAEFENILSKSYTY